MSLFMVKELNALFDSLQDDRSVRALVIRGANGHFCSGGDIKDMANARTQATADPATSFYALNRAFGVMINRANQLPQVVITVLEGAVLGGGFGLACISDVAIAAQSAQFGLPETSLGVIPAQIAPFVVQRVGLTQARRLALLGERFNGEEAVRLGIAHFLAKDAGETEQLLNRVLKQVKQCAPNANRVTKALLHRVGKVEMDVLLDDAALDFATAVQGTEGAEGTLAFAQKRPPSWAQ
jgi:isohexenylglutaconyl-CoA hydratase